MIWPSGSKPSGAGCHQGVIAVHIPVHIPVLVRIHPELHLQVLDAGYHFLIVEFPGRPEHQATKRGQ